MISKCRGCEEELFNVEMYSEMGLNFAGYGLYEKGHLIMIMVNDQGEIVIG